MSQVGLPFYDKAVAITKSDTVNFPDGPCDGIWVGDAGIVVVVFPNDTAVNFTCAAGTLLPVRAKRVNSATTSSTLMVAMYQV